MTVEPLHLHRLVVCFPVTPRDAALFDVLLAPLNIQPASGYSQPTVTSWPSSDLSDHFPSDIGFADPLRSLRDPGAADSRLTRAIEGAFSADAPGLLNELGADFEAGRLVASLSHQDRPVLYLLPKPAPEVTIPYLLDHTSLSGDRIALGLACRFLSAEAATRGADRIILSLGDMLARPAQTLALIAGRLGLDVPDRPALEIWMKNLKADFRIDTHSSAQLPAAEPTWLSSVTRMANGLNGSNGASELDSIRADILAAEPTIARVLTTAPTLDYAPSDLPEFTARRVHSATSRGDETELAKTRIELNMLQAKCAASESALSQIHASTSWRVTAPFRAIKTWLHRKMGPVASAPGLASPAALLASSARSIEPGLHALAKRRPGILCSTWHVGLYKAAQSAPPKKLPPVTISAVVYNSERWLPRFFETLCASKYPLRQITLIMVDNGSRDGTCDAINAFIQAKGTRFANVRLEHQPNDGYGAGNDHAIRLSQDEFLLVTNVDTEFAPDMLARLVSSAAADESDVASWEARQAPHEHPKYYDPVTLETNWSSHACILIRRQAYLDVGGYDRAIFMYGEDVELSYRFRRAGWRLRYVPAATLLHHVDLVDSSLRPQQLSGSLAANLLLRQRYGNKRDILSAEALFARARSAETDPTRIEAFRLASEQVQRQRDHFRARLCEIRDPDAAFSFDAFDFELARPGAGTILYCRDTSKTSMPRVSLVIRTHGDMLDHLEQALASALNQTYTNLEIIVVEDRTRAAKALVEKVASVYNARVRYVSSDGPGRSLAGNDGVEATTGEIIGFLDNDDLLFADHVELLVDRLLSDQDADAAYALAWEVQSQRSGPIRESGHMVPPSHLAPFDFYTLARENMIAIQSILFRKSLYNVHGGFHADLDRLEDWNLWVRYAAGKDFVKVDKVTSLYRTPMDPVVRARRQAELNRAYDAVYQRNMTDLKTSDTILDRQVLRSDAAQPVDSRVSGDT